MTQNDQPLGASSNEIAANQFGLPLRQASSYSW
jgi:hypothetical protein